MGKYEGFPAAARGAAEGAAEPQVIRAEGDTVTIPDAHLLFSGDFSRSGTDLVIVGEGQSVIVADYFGEAGSPALAAPNGAVLLPDVVSALAGPLAPGQYAQADDAQPAQGIGSVVTLSGSATAQRSDGTVVDLTVDSRLAEGDVVQTGSGSLLGIVFDDGTVFNINADTRMVLDELVYEPGGGSNSMLFNVVQGVFAFVAGQVAPTGEMRVDTPIATMGVRGTSCLGQIEDVIIFRVIPDPVTNNVGACVLFDRETGLVLAVSDSLDTQLVFDTATGQFVEQPADPAHEDIIQRLHDTFVRFAGVPGEQDEDTQQAAGSAGSGLQTSFSLTPAEITTIVALAGGAFPQIESLSGEPVSSGVDFGDEPEGSAFDPAPPPPPPPPEPGSSDPQHLPQRGFTGDDFGSVEEDGTSTATGQLLFDGGTGLIEPLVVEGSYGTFEIDADGNWVYTLDNDSDAVQSLGEGVIAEETFAVLSADGSETQFVTISIQGVNDVPTVTGTTTGAVVEDGTQVATGTITVDDPDAGESSVQPQSNVAGTYGTFSILADGNWTYTLDNADPAVQGLAEGETVTDTFTVTSFDGTVTETVEITITGTNDAPEVSALVGSFAEDDPGFSFDLLTGASDIDEGDELSTQGVDETITTTGGRELVLDTHYTVIGGVFALTADGLALFNSLAEGAEDSFVVNFEVTDGIDPVANTLSVTVEGANDAPVILDSSTLQGAVQEDVTLVVHGQVFAHDPDFGDTQTWSIVGGTQAKANYLVTIDNFTIIKNDALLFQDTFSDGTQPPSAPNFTEGNPTNYFTSGEFGESDGRAIMFGPDAVESIQGVGIAETFSMHFATLSTNIDPDNTTFGLKDHDSFTVEARFDLSMPQLSLESYGIRLIDSNLQQAGNDVVTLVVSRNSDGDLVVQFRQLNFETHTAIVLQTITLDPQPGDNQIDLRLTHDPETPGIVYASFALVRDGIAYSEFHFTETGAIFSDENWTRAQIVAAQPEQDQSVLFGNFGVLSLDDQGQWQYTLANHLPAVQALGEGETAEDTFTIRVTDAHGAYAEQTITVTVHGFNNPPVATDSMIATNEGVAAAGMLTGMDVDSDTVTFSLEEGPQNGTVVINADGSYVYTPDTGVTGPAEDSFTFRVTDGHGAFDIATVAVDIATGDEPKTITGTDGNDVLIGSAFNDVLFGGFGNDVLRSGGAPEEWHGSDRLYGGPGDDTLIAEGGFVILVGGPGNDVLTSTDTGLHYDFVMADYRSSPGGIVANLTGGTIGGLAPGEVADGLGTVDHVSRVHVIVDTPHDDVIHVDGSYTNSSGNWIEVRLSSGNDHVTFTGVDFARISYSYAQGPVLIDLEAGTATDLNVGDNFIGSDTFTGATAVRGSRFDDVILGRLDGNDDLRGNAGDDYIDGRGGINTISFAGAEAGIHVDLSQNPENRVLNDGHWNDSEGRYGIDEVHNVQNVNGSEWDDLIIGDAGDNVLRGGLGDDILVGGAGNDTLVGGPGNDTLVGGPGNDTLEGGAGADRFGFRSPDHGIDSIIDFTVSEDVLVIDASVFGGGLVAGDGLSQDQFVSGDAPVATEAHGQFLYDSTSGDLYWDVDGTGGQEAVLFANLADGFGAAPALTAADFELIGAGASFVGSSQVAAAVDGGGEAVA